MSKIEEVARAIAEVDGRGHWWEPPSATAARLDIDYEALRQRYYNRATAAIAAMRIPDEAMIEAGFRAEQDAAELANRNHLPLSQRQFLAVAFTAMIDSLITAANQGAGK